MNIALFIKFVAYIFLFRTTQCKNNESELYEIEGKIIGGRPAEIWKFSYAVLFFNHGNLCAGSVLNSYSVLTAAHCFDENMEKEIMYIQRSKYIEDENAEIFRVLSFVIHEKFNTITAFYADIALIFVKDPIKFSRDKKKALLVNNNKWMKSTNKAIIGIGWGWTKNTGLLSNIGLLRANLRFVPKRKCEALHRLKLTRDMFCLYGDGKRDTCKGDSGGGVIWNDTVVGIVSHGDGCAKKGKPSVYINVFYYRNWIKRQVANFFKDYCKIIENDNN